MRGDVFWPDVIRDEEGMGRRKGKRARKGKRKRADEKKREGPTPRKQSKRERKKGDTKTQRITKYA